MQSHGRCPRDRFHMSQPYIRLPGTPVLAQATAYADSWTYGFFSYCCVVRLSAPKLLGGSGLQLQLATEAEQVHDDDIVVARLHLSAAAAFQF